MTCDEGEASGLAVVKAGTMFVVTEVMIGSDDVFFGLFRAREDFVIVKNDKTFRTGRGPYQCFDRKKLLEDVERRCERLDGTHLCMRPFGDYEVHSLEPHTVDGH